MITPSTASAEKNEKSVAEQFPITRIFTLQTLVTSLMHTDPIVYLEISVSHTIIALYIYTHVILSTLRFTLIHNDKKQIIRNK